MSKTATVVFRLLVLALLLYIGVALDRVGRRLDALVENDSLTTSAREAKAQQLADFRQHTDEFLATACDGHPCAEPHDLTLGSMWSEVEWALGLAEPSGSFDPPANK